MTLANFQIAMARLIRLHDGIRPDTWRDDIAALDLDEAEWASLEALAVNEDLNMYGSEQAEQRWEMVERKLLRVYRSVDMDLLHEYWEQQFDPQHPTLEADSSTSRGTYTLAFLDALEAQPPAFLEEGALLCLKDVVSLERAEVQMSQHLCDDLALLAESPVTSHGWRLVELEHDILQWHSARAKALADDVAEPLPNVQQGSIVVLRTRGGMPPRIFEVDEPLRNFLRGEMGQGPRLDLTPEVKADLETLGLLRA